MPSLVLKENLINVNKIILLEFHNKTFNDFKNSLD